MTSKEIMDHANKLNLELSLELEHKWKEFIDRYLRSSSMEQKEQKTPWWLFEIFFIKGWVISWSYLWASFVLSIQKKFLTIIIFLFLDLKFTMTDLFWTEGLLLCLSHCWNWRFNESC
jgi:hypothetical protein